MLHMKSGIGLYNCIFMFLGDRSRMHDVVKGVSLGGMLVPRAAKTHITSGCGL